MNLFSKLKLLFTYGSELETLLQEKRSEKEIAKLMREKQFLNLCAIHQQRSPGTEYGEHNCDYCNLLKGQKRSIDNGERKDET